MHDDPLGPPFVAETLALPPDDEGEVVATLVRHAGAATTGRAVLYVHGFSDYFFQRAMAEHSLRPHQSAAFCRDVQEYFAELDLALSRIAADGPGEVVLSAHSTGALIGALYCHHRREPACTALVLNSPFFEFNEGWLSREVLLDLVTGTIARTHPYGVIPGAVSDLYGQSLHHAHHGEWDYRLEWKPLEGLPARAGWVAAIHRAHRELQAGIDVGVPVLVMTSARSIKAKRWTDDLLRADAVLDVAHMRAYAPGLGDAVTLVRIEGGMHDLVLSAPEVRARVYAELDRWLAAYGPTA
jgi:alpha-beta hydrolase superfamily lysophospholipase